MDQPIFYVECPREENTIRERRLKMATETKGKGGLSLWAEVCTLYAWSPSFQDSLQQTADGARGLNLMNWEDRTVGQKALGCESEEGHHGTERTRQTWVNPWKA